MNTVARQYMQKVPDTFSAPESNHSSIKHAVCVGDRLIIEPRPGRDGDGY